jgi:dTDP-4-dehydrorhamnose 3,5-epimerase
MKINKDFKIKGLLEFQPNVYGDDRGQFIETFNEDVLRSLGFNEHFKQDNQSISQRGVFRGIHLQSEPHGQGKLVRVISGAVLDVAVDIRTDSNTYGQHVAVELSKDNNRQLFIPPGFAHGFIALEENTVFSYKCTNYYAPDYEATICWNDPVLNINWGSETCLVSEKDNKGIDFSKFASDF